MTEYYVRENSVVLKFYVGVSSQNNQVNSFLSTAGPKLSLWIFETGQMKWAGKMIKTLFINESQSFVSKGFPSVP